MTATRAAVTAQASDGVATVRAFNRLYTNVIGVLRGGYLGTPYSLTEARLIFELGQRERCEVADLRRGLDIDAGYLSRILARFEADQLITRERSGTDARRQVIALTGAGRAAQAGLDAQAAEQIGALLASLTSRPGGGWSAGCRRSPACSATRRAPGPTCCGRPGRVTWAGWCSPRPRGTPGSTAGTPRSRPWWPGSWPTSRTIATRSGRRPGSPRWTGNRRVRCFASARMARWRSCGCCTWIPRRAGWGSEPGWWRSASASRGEAGYTEIMLWTSSVLAEARRIYQRFGFELQDEAPHRSFGQDLIGQNWSRPL